MSMKKKLLIAFGSVAAAIVLVVTSVLGTVAYLTSSAAVSNVFTVGDVGIRMTETKVNADGQKESNGEQVDTNTYHLIPGKTYSKDPTIFVDAASEDSYLFVLVRNDLKEIAKDGKTIAQQMEERGWARYTLASTGWVYVYCGLDEGAVPEGDHDEPVAGTNFTFAGKPTVARANQQYTLFETFTIDENADVSKYGAAKITLTAVAIQASTFGQVGTKEAIDKAWAAVVAEYPYIHTGSN